LSKENGLKSMQKLVDRNGSRVLAAFRMDVTDDTAVDLFGISDD
jgi:hypothetical protein